MTSDTRDLGPPPVGGSVGALVAVLMTVPLGALLTGCAPALDDPARFSTDAGAACENVQTEILWERCALAGCHAPGESAAGLELLSDGLADRLVGVDSTTCPGEPLIDPDDPAGSFLLMRLSDDPRCGDDEIERMPLTGVVLSDSEMRCVRDWVEQLARDHGGVP